MTTRINKISFKVKGGPTQTKNFAGIESKYDAEKGLSAANKKEIRKIVADQYKCKESDVIFSDEYTQPKPAKEESETGDETGNEKTAYQKTGSGKTGGDK